MHEVVLRVHNLSVRSEKGKFLIQDVSFVVHKGEWVTITGTNGAGKSTLLEAIAAQRSRSQVKSNRQSIRGSLYQPTDFAYIPQKIEFSPQMPMRLKNFLQIGRSKDILSKEAWLLSLLSLEELLSSDIQALSDGERQRAVLFRALSLEMPLFLLDEPEQNLDDYHLETLYRALHHLQSKKNAAILLVSHEKDRASKFSHRVLTIDKTICCEETHIELINKDSVVGAVHHHHAEAR